MLLRPPESCSAFVNAFKARSVLPVRSGRLPELHEANPKIRGDVEDLLRVFDSPRIVACLEGNLGSHRVMKGLERFQVECPLHGGRSLRVSTHLRQQVAQHAMGKGVMRIELNCPAQRGLRARPLLLEKERELSRRRLHFRELGLGFRAAFTASRALTTTTFGGASALKALPT